MKISSRGRYALRLMVDLSHQYDTGRYESLKDIAERQKISLKYLEQISTQLCKEGFLHSQRGVGGGYKLTARPNELTIGQILRAVQGPLAPVGCDGAATPCPECVNCTSLSFWEGLNQAVNEYADSYTLEDFAKQPTIVYEAQ